MRKFAPGATASYVRNIREPLSRSGAVLLTAATASAPAGEAVS